MFGLSRVTIYEGFVGLSFRNGRLAGVLEPGRYWRSGPGHRITAVDTRPTSSLIGGTETATSDGGPLRVSVVATTRIADPALHYRSIKSEESRLGYTMGETGVGDTRLYYQINIGIRDWVMARSFADALEQRANLAKDILPTVGDVGRQLGIEVMSLDLLEFAPAGSLKSAIAERLRVQIEGETALARARNEAATMRNLLNTARLVREHPGLLELRVLSSGQKPKVTFVVGGTDKPGTASETVVEEP